MHRLHFEALVMFSIVALLLGALLINIPSSGFLGQTIKTVEEIKDEKVSQTRMVLYFVSAVAVVLVVLYLLLRKNDIQPVEY